MPIDPALAPVEKGKEREVLYGLDLKTERGLQLVLVANRCEQGEILRVTTRSEAREEASDRKEEERAVAVEKPQVKAVKPARPAVDSRVGRPGEGGPVADRPAGTPKPGPAVTEIGSRVEEVQGEPAADRPVGDPLPDEDENSLAEDSLAEECWAEDDEELEEEWYCVKQRGKEVELEIPPVKPGKSTRAELVREVRADPSLHAWRDLANKEE